MKVYGYVRVSTEEQAREGVSLAAQRAQGVSYDAIATQLNAEVIPSTVPGGRWFANTVRRVLLATHRTPIPTEERMSEDNRLLTIEEAAQQLGMSEYTTK